MKINQLANRSLLIATIFIATLTACGKAPPLPPPPVDENSYPVSHWLNDADPCVRKTAAAIIKSGLPYPNIVRKDPSTVTERDKRLGNDIISYDAWVGDVRLVIPAKYAAVSDTPVSHPGRVSHMDGSMPNFYPKGPQGPEIKGMGSDVEAGWGCLMTEADFVNQFKGPEKDWHWAYSTEQGIAIDKANFEKEAAESRARDLNTKLHEEHIAFEQKERQAKARQHWEYDLLHPRKVSINRRDDLGMTEVLLYQDITAEASKEGVARDTIHVTRASYWPYKELKSPDGYVTNFSCENAHFAEDWHVYGSAYYCKGYAHLNANISIGYRFKVTQLVHAISMHEQFKQAVTDFIAAGKYTPVNPIPEQVNQSNKK